MLEREADRVCRGHEVDAAAAVVREMCKGSEEAFGDFYIQYSSMVLRIALKMTGDRMEAEDICHDVFLEALRKGHRYRADKGSVASWLAVMTRSRCIDRLRKRSRIIAVDSTERHDQWVSGETAEQAVLHKAERLALREALQELPLVQRKAVVTSYYDGLTHRELASEWEVPLGTVKSWIRYGIGNLRKLLRKRGWENDNLEGRERKHERAVER